jgi:hypothetical protein
MATRQKNPTVPAPQLANGHDVTVEGEADANANPQDPAVEIVEGGGELDASGAQTGDDGINDLAAQLADEKRKREEIERENARLRAEQQQSQREVVDNRMLVLDATIQRQEGEKQSILDDIKAAKEAGDYDKEVELTDKLSQINIDLKQTRLGKARLESELEDGGGQQPQQMQRQSSDSPVEQMIRAGRLDPRSANWLRAHPEYAEAGPNNDKLQRAHAYAMSHDGVAPATDEYFRLIEERLGLRQAADDGGGEGGQQQNNQQQPRSMAPPAAPPSRGNGMGGGGRVIMDGIVDLGNGKFRVAPHIKAFAESIGMSTQDYVQQAVALKNEGQIH